jgi:hypothetical protein
MNAVRRAIGVGLLYLPTIGTGICLSNSGRPLSTLFITVHKLIALATVVLTSMLFWRLLKHVHMGAVLAGLIIASAVLVIALFATGALLSTGKPIKSPLLTIHQLAPVLLGLSIGATAYLLIR